MKRVLFLTACLVAVLSLFTVCFAVRQISSTELEKLLEGNKNFIAGNPTAKNMCLKTLQSLALYQEPDEHR